ncbi:MAG: purine-binding chemotaxis protein CheW [Leptospiraceae bacterium]|nr:purine-binding chemotaxis protein CheW [Leptospiraceae bacterium]
MSVTELSVNEEDTMQDLFIIFNLDDKEFGIEIRFLIEIIAFQAITQIPNLPEYIRGVINLRGKVIPVIDVRLRFGMPSKEYNDFTCILIVHHNEITSGLIVDGVREVLRIPADDIEPSPGFESSSVERFIDSIGKAEDKLKILINLDKFIREKDVASAI